MSRVKQHLSSLLERYRHLQTQDIELVLRRIFDLGEDQARVLSDLGISRDEVTRISEELRWMSKPSNTKQNTGSQPQLPPVPHTHYQTPSSGIKPVRGEGAPSISRQQALHQGMSPRKRSRNARRRNGRRHARYGRHGHVRRAF